MKPEKSHQIFDSGELYDDYKSDPLYRKFLRKIDNAKQGGIPIDFKITKEDFIRFKNIIGPIPEYMKSPTIGRYDHNKGYVWDRENNRWNFRWEPKSDNSRELMLRIKPHGYQTPEEKSKTSREMQLARLKAGTHISQTGKSASYLGISGFDTGTAGKASAKSPNSINNQLFTCSGCGKTKGSGRWKQHCDNLLCQKKGYRDRDPKVLGGK
jgi:hypothetical protein